MKHASNDEVEDRRVRKTKKAIREALQTLLLANGIERITTKQLAAEADIGYTTFFRHFPTKEAALADLAESEAEALIEHCFPLLRAANSRSACLALCRYVSGKRRVWSALLSGSAAGMVSEALVRNTVKRSSAWPRGRSWLPAESGTTLAIGLVVHVLGWWLSHAPELSDVQVAEIMDRLFVSALVEERG